MSCRLQCCAHRLWSLLTCFHQYNALYHRLISSLCSVSCRLQCCAHGLWSLLTVSISTIHCIIDLCSVCCVSADCKFMLYPPSMIAAGCIGASVRGLNEGLPSITETLHKITGIELVSSAFCLSACRKVFSSTRTIALESGLHVLNPLDLARCKKFKDSTARSINQSINIYFILMSVHTTWAGCIAEPPWRVQFLS